MIFSNYNPGDLKRRKTLMDASLFFFKYLEV